MATHTFLTSADAHQAGFVSPSVRRIERYNDGEIKIIDTSGPNSFGYDFSIIAYSHTNDERAKRLGPFGSTVSMSLTEAKNRGGGIGAFCEMFDPDTYRQAIEAARAAIDAEG